MSQEGNGPTNPSDAPALRTVPALTGSQTSEAKYRRLIDGARLGIVQTTPEGLILTANPAFARILGYESTEELIRTAPSMVSHYADVADREKLVARLEQQGSVTDYELLVRRKLGDLTWVSIDLQRVSYEHGATLYEGTLVDIAGRKRTEAAVQEAAVHLVRRRRIAVLKEFAILAAIMALFYGLAVYSNGFESVSGWVLARLDGRQLVELILATVLVIAGFSVFEFRRWREAETETTSQHQRQRASELLRDDLEVRVQQRTTELRESNAALRREGEERARAESALRLQSAALSAAANAIVITDREGIIVWVNAAFSTLTGYPFAEAVGKNPRELVKSGRQERDFYENLWQTITSGRVWHGELVNRRKDGSFYPEEQTITPLRDATGVITHFIAIKQDLTERHAAEFTMQANRRRFQAVFEQAAVGIVIAEGEDWRIVDVNRRFCEIVGRTAAELIHHTSASITHPDDIPRDSDPMEQSTHGDPQHFSREKRYLKKDGSPVWVKAFVASLDPTDPASTLRIGVFEDITERKQMEAAQRETEARYRLLFEQSPDGIVVIDPETMRFLEFNEAAHRQLGYSREEFAGLSLFEIDTAFTPAEISEGIARVIRTGRGDFETRHRTRQGESREIHVTAQYVELAGRQIYHCVWRDITERKDAERQLREQAEIIANAHEGVMIVNLDDKVALWNRGAERMFGWSAAEALGRSPDDVLGDRNPGAVSTLRAAVERDGFWNGEMRGQTRDGRTLILDCRTTLVRDAAGAPRARLNFFADITEKKLLEEKFLHAQRLESIGMLAAGIAHDLNNVLAPILFAGPLLRDSLTKERDLKILGNLERSAERGAGLVKQILGFVHATTGVFRSVQVKHLARDIASIIEETFPKSIQFEHQIPTDLWPVQGDPTQIHQVLLNLCINARDAMPAGGTLRLSVVNQRLDEAGAGAIAGARAGAWLVVEVADTGTGIPPDVLAHIWEPFFTTKETGKGTGLGLSTVRGIVAHHHGFIALETAPGHGTTFRVFLPASLEESARADLKPAFAAPVGSEELILVVDDDTPIRETVALILKRHNYRVIVAADGVEALNLFATHFAEIAMVITDVDMPNLSGDALVRTLRLYRSDLPLLVISGLSADRSDRSEGETARKIAGTFLLKPFIPEALLDRVHRLLHPTGKS